MNYISTTRRGKPMCLPLLGRATVRPPNTATPTHRMFSSPLF